MPIHPISTIMSRAQREILCGLTTQLSDDTHLLRISELLKTYIGGCFLGLLKIGADAKRFGKHLSVELQLDYFTHVPRPLRQRVGFGAIEVEKFNYQKRQE